MTTTAPALNAKSLTLEFAGLPSPLRTDQPAVGAGSCPEDCHYCSGPETD
jgi:hypothetical protein